MVKDLIIDYIVDEKNRIVIATGLLPIYVPCEKGCGEQKVITTLARAKARCKEGDEFDVEYGKKLAQRRLLIKVNKVERQWTERRLAEAKKELQLVCDHYDKLNNELKRHMTKLKEIQTAKYGEANDD